MGQIHPTAIAEAQLHESVEVGRRLYADRAARDDRCRHHGWPPLRACQPPLVTSDNRIFQFNPSAANQAKVMRAPTTLVIGATATPLRVLHVTVGAR